MARAYQGSSTRALDTPGRGGGRGGGGGGRTQIIEIPASRPRTGRVGAERAGRADPPSAPAGSHEAGARPGEESAPKGGRRPERSTNKKKRAQSRVVIGNSFGMSMNGRRPKARVYNSGGESR